MSQGREPPPAPAGFEAEGQVVYSWARDRGASELVARRIVGLLTIPWLCDLPRPPRTHRSSGRSSAQWFRYLFRRHCGRLLGWTDRIEEGDPAGFSPEVNRLLRERFFPDGVVDGHGAREGEVPGQGDGEIRVVGKPKHSAASEAEDGDGTSCGASAKPGGGGACAIAAGGSPPGCGHRGSPAGGQPRRTLPAWFRRREPGEGELQGKGSRDARTRSPGGARQGACQRAKRGRGARD